MNYFDGIKVGDKVYKWDEEFEVDSISNLFFQAKNARNTLLVTYQQPIIGGQEWFWQPIVKPVAPPRPKRKVSKDAMEYLGHREGGFWVCKFAVPESATNITPSCTYMVEE